MRQSGSMPFNSLYIIDPSIENLAGHYAEYARAVGQFAKSVHLTPTILCHRSVAAGLAAELGAVPTFRKKFWWRWTRRRKLGMILNPIAANWFFYVDLRLALGWRDYSHAVLFMPTVDHHQMLAWALWLSQTPIQRRPRVVLLLRYTYFHGDSQRPNPQGAMWLPRVFNALSRFSRMGNLRIVTDSARLARQYNQFTACPLEVVPIPHTADVSHADMASMVQAVSVSDHPIRFVSLGGARSEKGFGLIAEAIEHLARFRRRALAHMEFVLQCNVTDAIHTDTYVFQEQLARLRLTNVRLVAETLDRKDYTDLLASADVALFPYSRDIYYARTSGPFTEALAAGKPVIATDDTWMSDQLVDYGAGMTIRDGRASDLFEQMEAAIEQHPRLAQQASERQSAWTAFHNPGSLLKSLLN